MKKRSVRQLGLFDNEDYSDESLSKDIQIEDLEAEVNRLELQLSEVQDETKKMKDVLSAVKKILKLVEVKTY